MKKQQPEAITYNGQQLKIKPDTITVKAIEFMVTVNQYDLVWIISQN